MKSLLRGTSPLTAPAWVSLAALLTCAVPTEARALSILRSLDGAAYLTVLASDGTKREVKADELLQNGDIISTGPQVAVTIAFEQGAQVLAAGDVKMRIGDEAEETGEPNVPSVEVQEGDVRAVVESFRPSPEQVATETHASPVPLAKSHRFFIRTPSVVMGVRGTDFVVSALGDRAALNTLSGTVEVASDLKGLKGPGMVSVTSGMALSGEAPKPFVASEFLREFHKKHPQLEKLYKKAERDIQDGSLSQKFAALQEDALKLKKGDTPDMIEFPGKKKPLKTPTPGR